MPRQFVAEIIQARVEEIFELIDQELIKSSVKPALAGGIILCGGTALLEGIDELCSEKIGLATAIRSPAGDTLDLETECSHQNLPPL